MDPRYELTKTPSSDNVWRTEWNVRNMDGTMLFTMVANLMGTSNCTAQVSARHAKPLIHFSHEADEAATAASLLAFVLDHGISVLNIDGSRASAGSSW